MTQLTHTAGTGEWATKPTWTPDGAAIIFTLVTGIHDGPVDPGSVHTAFIDPDGTDRRVLDGGHTAGPRLRPTP